jgi:hypothetical protein
MAIVLRQSTAVDVLIGPFVDSTDGVTAETGLTIAQADVRLSKNGQNMAQKNDNTACVHDEIGYYNCELDATDTDTIGALTLSVAESGALAVRHDFQVVDAGVYDAIYASSPTLITSQDIGQLYESAITTVNSQTSFDMTTNIVTDDNWIGNLCTIEDVTTNEIVTHYVSDVDQANDRIIIDSAPVFTVATSDVIRVHAQKHPEWANAQYDGATHDELVALFQLLLRSDSAINTDRASTLTLINTDQGSGAGDYSNTTDSVEARADAVDDVNVAQMNGTTLEGTGEPGDLWR